MIEYIYSKVNSLEDPKVYDFTRFKFEGKDFLEIYKESRNKAIEICRKKTSNSEIQKYNSDFDVEKTEEIDTLELLKKINYCFNTDIDEADKNMKKLIKKYEVTKKLFEKYNKEFKSEEGSCENFLIYSLFSINLYLGYKKIKTLDYLNALIKVNDMLIANLNKLNNEENSLVLNSLIYEIKIIQEMINKHAN